MNIKLFPLSLITTTIAILMLNFLAQVAQSEPKYQFFCGQSYDADTNQRLPATVARTNRGKIVLIQWKTATFPGYSAQRRCQEVSPRFQKAYNDGTLNLITNGQMAGQPVICTAKKYGGECQTLLMTLQPQDNSLQILNDLRDTLNLYQVGPIKHNSGVTQIYYQINLDDFIRNAPVQKEK